MGKQPNDEDEDEKLRKEYHEALENLDLLRGYTPEKKEPEEEPDSEPTPKPEEKPNENKDS